MTGPRIRGDWIDAPGAQAVCRLLTDAGYEAHFVGGCVRNDLIGAPITDLDISTNARPDQVMSLAKTAGVHAIPTGIDHGTVTIVQDGEPYEITTWRRDVETDGRRATVAFADTLEEDARRRDFTMNALYAAPDGTVEDPLSGLPDLTARRVRFIDDAHQRIREDYLRILRFFRFHAWYGAPDGGLDADALAAIAALKDGIDGLSRERVGSEMLKLLGAPDPAPAVAVMGQLGVLAHVLDGLDPKALPLLIHFESELGIAPDAIRRLAVLGGQDHRDGLRLSKADARRLDRLLEARGSAETPEALGYRFGAQTGLDILLMNAALLETPPEADIKARVAVGAAADFPVVAGDLIDRFQGPALGARLRELENQWIASGFSLSHEQLLDLP